MSVRFDADADILKRTASLPAATAYSACGWAIPAGLTGTQAIQNLVDAEGSSLDRVQLAFVGADLFIIASNGSFTGGWFTGINSTPMFWAVTCDGTTRTAYAANLSDASLSTGSVAGSSFTPGLMCLANRYTNGGEGFNGTVSAVKAWDAVLTQAEIEQERWTILPRRFADLHLWTPMFPGSGERVRDYSGNGKDWTEGGTLADEDGPPVSWGASSIMLPFAAASGIAIPVLMRQYQQRWK